MRFRIRIEIVSKLNKPGLYEIGGRLLEGNLNRGSVGQVEVDGSSIVLTVKDVAYLRPQPRDKIAFSVEDLPCAAESLVGRDFVSI
jgi:hypothetical protein